MGAAFAMLAALTAAGCLDAPGTGQSFYVLIPYMISLIAGISVCWALGRLTAGGGELRAYVYEATVEQLPVRSGFAIFGAGAAILGELVYILKNGTEGKGIGCVIFLVLEGFVCGMTLIIKKQSSKMEWEKTILTETEKR